MAHFTEEQIAELEAIFGIKRVWKVAEKVKIPDDCVDILDGRLMRSDDYIWWHCDEGPELVKVSEHWWNIREFPLIYSFNKPEWDDEKSCYIGS